MLKGILAAVVLVLAALGARAQPTPTLKGHKGTITCVVYSGDGKRLASGSQDNTVRLWDPSAGTLVAVLKGHADVVGAKLVLAAGGRLQTRYAVGGGSYASANDRRLVFGLGKTEAA